MKNVRMLDNFICEYLCFLFFSILFWPKSMGSIHVLKVMFNKNGFYRIPYWVHKCFFFHSYCIYVLLMGTQWSVLSLLNIHIVDRPLYMFIMSKCRKLLVIAWWCFFYCSLCSRAHSVCLSHHNDIKSILFDLSLNYILYNALFSPNSSLQ